MNVTATRFSTQARTWVLIAGLSALLIAIGGRFLGGAGYLLFGGISVVFVFVSYWFSDRFAIRSAHAQPISEADDPRLYAIIENMLVLSRAESGDPPEAEPLLVSHLASEVVNKFKARSTRPVSVEVQPGLPPAMGNPTFYSQIVGNLLGTRMVLNELVAFSMLGPQRAVLDPRSFTIATFALCGFANLSSIGIQIGGIGALAPNKKGELARLGIRAMLAGTMANLMSASIAGMLL